MSSPGSIEALVRQPGSAYRSPRWPHPTWWDIAGLLGPFALALTLCLRTVGERNLWIDELTSLSYAAQPADRVMTIIALDPNMLLYYLLLGGWVRLVGVDAAEAVLRLPTALVSAATVPLIYILGRRLHSPVAGLAAALLLATNSYHVWRMPELRSYAMLVFLVVLSYLVLVRAIRGHGWSSWLGLGLVHAVASGFHFLDGFILLSQFVIGVGTWSRRVILGLGLAALIAVLGFGPLLLFLLSPRPGQSMVASETGSAEILGTTFLSLSGRSLPLAILYGSLIALAILPLGRSLPTAEAVRVLLSWTILPALFLLLASRLTPVYKEKYLVICLPGLALLAGIGVARLADHLRLIALGALVAVLVLSVTTSRTHFLYRANEAWGSAARGVRRSLEPSDGLIFISRWGQNGFEYYAGWHWQPNRERDTQVFKPLDWDRLTTRYGEAAPTDLAELPAFAAAHRRIWLIRSHSIDLTTGSDRARPISDALAKQGYEATVRGGRGVDVVLFVRPP